MTILKPHAYRRPPRSSVGRALERASQVVTHWTGSSWAFALAAAVIVAWLVTGPIFHFSDTWQLVINTGTTIVTFLMVFLIQRAQNKDALAIQLKLNEIVAAIQGASNRLIAVEELSEPELKALHAHYCRLAEMAKRDVDVLRSHSIEEAEQRHRRKQRQVPPPVAAPDGPPPADPHRPVSVDKKR
jgi:low affinity Fe/Cu permease